MLHINSTIFQIHGLLHLLGFDDEISDEAEAEMEKEEELVLKSLGWKGKGLIKSARDVNVRQIQAGRSDGMFWVMSPRFANSTHD